MEYRVVVGDSASLPELVNPLLIDGWELQGGISAHTRISQFVARSGTANGYVEVWAQAMIKKDNRNNTNHTPTHDITLDNKAIESLQEAVAKSFGGNSKYRKQRTISSRDIKKQHPRNKRHTRKH